MNFLMLVFAFFFSLFTIYLMIRYAETFGLVDTPCERSMHSKCMPRGAGIGFVSTIFVASLLFDYALVIEYYYIYLALFIVFAMGVVDDKADTSPRLKFLFIFFAVTLLFFNDFYIDGLGSYFGLEISLPGWLAFVFTFFAISGFTNALNLIDGLDGLAGSVSIVMFSAFLALGIIHDDQLLITLSSLFIVTLFAFLYFNWNPARIFMGDSGSLSLGFTISLLAVRSLDYIEAPTILFLAAVPILDTLIVMTRRIQRHTSPFTADKNHLHHLMFRMKDDVKFVVILILYIQVAFTIIGIQVRQADSALTLILFGILFFILLELADQRIRKRKVIKKADEKALPDEAEPRKSLKEKIRTTVTSPEFWLFEESTSKHKPTDGTTNSKKEEKTEE